MNDNRDNSHSANKHQLWELIRLRLQNSDQLVRTTDGHNYLLNDAENRQIPINNG